MGKLITFFFFFAVSLPIFCQGPVLHVAGTVADTDGVTTAGIPVFVTTAFSDSTFFFMDAITDEQGNYELFIDVVSGDTAGVVHAGVPDCNGAFLEQSQTWQLNNTDTVQVLMNFNYCENIIIDSLCAVFIVEDVDPNGQSILTALSPIWPLNDVIEYVWSTGDVGPSIIPTEAGQYCVTATFFDSCQATACYDFVPDTNGNCWTYIDLSFNNIDSTTGGGFFPATLSAVATGVAPFIYQWDTGELTQSIQVGPGVYCVTTTDANGCVASACIEVTDFELCEVFIFEEFGPNGQTFLTAFTPIFFANDFASFLWSTGETTQSILPDGAGTYCVTATFSDSCVATSCYDYFPDSNGNCWAYIELEYGTSDTVAGGILPITTLTAIPSGVAPYTYLWDTGEQTQSIEVGPGIYCVTAIDAEGCVAEACIEVIDFSFCDVFIGCDPPGSFQAIAFGAPPFNYLWSTGDTSMALYPTEPGEYCVTVTDATGCEVSTCAIFDTIPQIDSCLSFIIFNFDSANVIGSPLDSQITLSVISFGMAPFTYEWNTGETTESITVSDFSDLYCVTVTDAAGCVSTACSDIWNGFCTSWIEVSYLDDGTAQLDAFSESLAPAVDWVWSNGDVGPTTNVSESGTYCVTVVDATGCTSEACAWVDFNILNDSCFVFIVPFVDSTQDQLIVEAINYGVAPFTYLWSDGTVSNTAVVSDPNTQLCVTVTDANGCVASACIFDFIDPCDIYIEQSFVASDSAVVLSVQSLFGMPVSGDYVWSTGETTNSISVTDEGTYCVTATFSNNCISEACTEVIFFPIDTFTATLGGYVVAEIDAILSGTVYAFALTELDSINNTLEYTLIDSTRIRDDNYYVFPDIPVGVYLIKAELDEGTPGADIYFPTYHYDAVMWENAIPVFVPNWLAVTTDIILQSTNTTGGGGMIGGTLLDPNGLLADQSSILRFGGLAGVEIVLIHQTAGNFRFTYTDTDGNFSFDNLPWGTYKLTYDYPGLNAPEVWITIGPSNPESSQVLLNAGGTTVGTADETFAQSIHIFPNPTNDWAEIEIDGVAGKVQVELYGLNGQRLFSSNHQIEKGEKIRVDFSSYEQGAYLLEMITDVGKATRIIMKQ